ncbi:MAG: hypothetical protein QM698_12310 [Micropepsaceae bacterium]
MANPAPIEPGIHQLPHARIDWISLFLGLTVAALMTATACVAVMTGFDHKSTATVFVFAFGYAFLAALAIGLPALSRLIRRRALNWKTAAMAGAFSAALPGVTFVLLIANCGNNAVMAGVTMCVDGSRTFASWGWAAGLIAAMSAGGALAALVGFGVYKAMKQLISPHH